MKTILIDHGIRHLELEMLGNWFASGPTRATSDIVRRDLLAASEVLRPRQIKVGGDYGGNAWPPELLAEEFTLLCRQAADAGTRAALEPMPFSNFPDIHAGRAFMDAVGHPAGGLLIDIWHVCRARTPYADVAALPADLIFAVELDDADEVVVGTLLEDTLHQRRLCGEGSFDVAGFVDAIRQTGYDGPWGVEIISHQHRARPLAEQVRRAFDTTAPFLA
jgi:sugar phosphate isomerase/epimerase